MSEGEPDDDGAWTPVTADWMTLAEKLAAIAERMRQCERVSLADLARQLEADDEIPAADKRELLRRGAVALHRHVREQTALMQISLVESLDPIPPDTTH
jgi:hypothetical protein